MEAGECSPASCLRKHRASHLASLLIGLLKGVRRAVIKVLIPDWSARLSTGGGPASRARVNMAATVERGASANPSEKQMSAKKALSAASPLTLRIVAECSVTKARACELILPHSAVSTPVFMPVGTQGTLKGITVDQLDGLGCRICLGNTYHLGMRPVGFTTTTITTSRIYYEFLLFTAAPVYTILSLLNMFFSISSAHRGLI